MGDEPEPDGRRGHRVDDDGVIVGQGFHEQAGGAHAEAHALEMAGARARGATLVLHARAVLPHRAHRRAPRLVEAGIARVVAAIGDPNPLVDGRGFAYLRAKASTWKSACREEAAAR